MSATTKPRRGWALVTGASAGLGVEFAKQLAEKGYDLVLVARRKDRMEALAAELTKQNGIECVVHAQDLGEAGAGTRLMEVLDARGIVPEVLVNNAGFGAQGQAVELDVPRQMQMLQLNIATLTELSLLVGRKMAARGSGGIINVASTAAFQPTPGFAVYSATKAYVLSLSMAMAHELAPRGVRVLAHCPGGTLTEFFEAGDVKVQAGSMVYMSAERCVRIGLASLESGRRMVVTGFVNKVTAFFARVSPLFMVVRVAGWVMRRG